MYNVYVCSYGPTQSIPYNAMSIKMGIFTRDWYNSKKTIAANKTDVLDRGTNRRREFTCIHPYFTTNVVPVHATTILVRQLSLPRSCLLSRMLKKLDRKIRFDLAKSKLQWIRNNFQKRSLPVPSIVARQQLVIATAREDWASSKRCFPRTLRSTSKGFKHVAALIIYLCFWF